MCGIVGYVGPTPKKEGSAYAQKVGFLMDQLFIEDERRGKHSTGYMMINTVDRTTTMRKAPLPGTTFIAGGHTRPIYTKGGGVIIGHNRFATHGEVNAQNAHPFVVDRRWVGVHNGIINAHEKVARHFGIQPSNVDSETIIRCIAKLCSEGKTTEDAIADVTKELPPNSKYAFVFRDVRELHTYIWRQESPMWVFDLRGLAKNGFGLLGRVFCSTKVIFDDAYRRCQGLLGPRDVVKGFELTPHRLYRLSDKNLNLEVVIKKMTVQEPKEKPRDIRHHSYGGSSHTHFPTRSERISTRQEPSSELPWHNGNLFEDDDSNITSFEEKRLTLKSMGISNADIDENALLDRFEEEREKHYRSFFGDGCPTPSQCPEGYGQNSDCEGCPEEEVCDLDRRLSDRINDDFS